MNPGEIEVSERGYLELATSDPRWIRLRDEPDFWRLIDRGVIRVSERSRSTIRLEGSKYVGRALLGGVPLSIPPKIPGALQSLMAFAAGDAFRLEEVSSPATELGPLASLLVTQFVKRATSYASRGRDFRYKRVAEFSSVAGGRIDVARTMRLRARGMGHLLAFDRVVIAFDTRKNRLIRAALRDVQLIASAVGLPDSQLAAARGLAMLFDDCVDAEVLFGQRAALVREVATMRAASQSPEERDLLGLAGVILSRASFEDTELRGDSVPRAWFLNLEELFETAVFHVLASLLPKHFGLIHGKLLHPPIFPQIANRYTAEPDLVLLKNGVAEAVGDVKYKEWTGVVKDPGDLYQLLSHATAFGVDRCFLVYPHDRMEIVELGRSTTGARTWLIAVDVRTIARDLMAALSTIGIPVVTTAYDGVGAS